MDEESFCFDTTCNTPEVTLVILVNLYNEQWNSMDDCCIENQWK